MSRLPHIADALQDLLLVAAQELKSGEAAAHVFRPLRGTSGYYRQKEACGPICSAGVSSVHFVYQVVMQHLSTS